MPTSNSEPSSDWLLTVTGKSLLVMDPNPDDIDIIDISHGLSNICRFGGQCYTFFSVAQHSVFVSRLLHGPNEMKMTGLLHDATEAYLGDVISPLKRNLPDYKVIEAIWWRAIAKRFGLHPDLSEIPEIKIADDIALLTERRDLMPPSPGTWREDKRAHAHDQQVRPLASADARMLFMDRFREVGGIAA